jgi:hypothetical protein
MKRLCLAAVTAMFFLVCSNGLRAQTNKTEINQLEVMKRFIGTWQANVGKDTIEIWDCQPYGEGFIVTVYRITNGQKTQYYVNNVGFDSLDGKLKGYVLWPSGDYMTWIAEYNAEKKFKVDLVVNFNPAAVWTRYEMVYLSSKERVWINYNLSGEKISELKFVRIK